MKFSFINGIFLYKPLWKHAFYNATLNRPFEYSENKIKEHMVIDYTPW